MADDELMELITDLPRFSAEFLKVRTKEGDIRPFVLNKAQMHLHERLEAQKREMGYVKAVVLKGRQQGCSTYVQARYFHQVITTLGKRAYILTHEAEATKNLFDMTKRYNDLLEEGLAPLPDKSSAKELNFSTLNSGYSVGTAGNKGAGRSQTIQLFHGSEVAFWPNAEEHAKGVLQAVAKIGTEIILESTANGMGNYFHGLYKACLTGKSEFQFIFIPWYWQDEYKLFLPKETAPLLTDEEEELLLKFGDDGLTKEHLYWRRSKIAEFSDDYETGKESFMQEYPFTADEAFRNPVKDRFINAKLVDTARKNNIQSDSPLIIGCDPARSDTDRCAIIRRKGRLAYGLETFHNLNTMEIAGKLRRIIELERPEKVCIDVIGIGAGVYDRLKEIGFECVEAVNVAESPMDKQKFRNLRAELWSDMRDWFASNIPVQIPDSDELMSDLTSLGYKFDSSGRLLIESKDDLKKRGMLSPDTADALSLTFSVGFYSHSSTSMNVKFAPEHSNNMFT